MLTSRDETTSGAHCQLLALNVVVHLPGWSGDIRVSIERNVPVVDAVSMMRTRSADGLAERALRRRESVTRSFTVGGAYGFLIASRHPDGSLADINLIMSKQGSTLRGMTETVALAISTGLAHGVPLATFVGQFIDLRFEPAGLTDDPELPRATSIIDYVVRRLALDFLTVEERAALGALTPEERAELVTESTGVRPDALGVQMMTPFEIPSQLVR